VSTTTAIDSVEAQIGEAVPAAAVLLRLVHFPLRQQMHAMHGSKHFASFITFTAVRAGVLND
jgi:hypothetical protein